MGENELMVKESIINAYEQKTNLPRNKISNMMDAETWFSAQKAVELGFVDKILYAPETNDAKEGFIFDKMTVTNSLINKLPKSQKESVDIFTGSDYKDLMKRLELLKQ